MQLSYKVEVVIQMNVLSNQIAVIYGWMLMIILTGTPRGCENEEKDVALSPVETAPHTVTPPL
jgi:hypothetical protein